MRLSFRSRLTLWYTVVLSALLIVSAVVLFITLQNAAKRKLDATLWLIGSTEAEGTSARLRDRGDTDPDDLTVRDIDIADLAGYDLFRFERYVTVVTETHRVADFSLNLSSQPLPFNDDYVNQALAGRIKFETVVVPAIGSLRMVYVPVLGHETKPFVVIVGVPTEFGANELYSLRIELIGIVLVFLTLAAISGWFLARWTMRPIRETAVAVRGISERNLHERLPQPQTNDEIDNLITVFNQLLGRLEESFEFQKRFTADASHEIGTPLTTLKGQTEVALLEYHTPEEYETLLRSNLDEIENLSRIINNLLMLARADTGEEQISSEVLELNVLVREAVDRMRPAAMASGVDLSLHVTGPVYILGDQTAIEQIISNLFQNSVRYTLAGGTVSVKVGLDKDNNAFVEVVDSGIGIEEADLPYIFERFYRARNARLQRSEGSGLGLSISYLLAEALGGNITARSESGKGSQFVFSMPALVYTQE